VKVGIQSTVTLISSLVLLTMPTSLLALYVLQGKAIGAPQGVPAISEAQNDNI